MNALNKGFDKKENNNVDNFIQCYDNVFSDIECKYLIDSFESSKRLHTSGDVIIENQKVNDSSIKESTEINIGPEFLEDEVWSPCLELILSRLSESMEKYIKRYEVYVDDGEVVGLDSISRWGIEERFNFQKFEQNQGYKKWHCETSNGASSSRVLTWMIYLNDVPDGGTYFLNNDTMEAREGRLVIWPPYWTHFHKSQISKKTTKYILTGWFSFF